MKNLFTSVCLLSVSFLLSCSGKDEPKITPAPVITGCKPIAYSYAAPSIGISDSVKFIYDASGRLIRKQYIGRGNIDFKYDQSGRLVQALYFDGKVEEERRYNSNGVLTKLTNFPITGNTQTDSSEQILTYDAGDKLKSITYSISKAGIKKATHLKKIYYASPDIISADSLFDLSTGTSEFLSTQIYMYDNKTGIMGVGIDMDSRRIPYQFYFAKHNITSISSACCGGQTSHETVTIDYNKYGYPVKKTFSLSGGSHQSTVKIYYNCF